VRFPKKKKIIENKMFVLGGVGKGGQWRHVSRQVSCTVLKVHITVSFTFYVHTIHME